MYVHGNPINYVDPTGNENVFWVDNVGGSGSGGGSDYTVAYGGGGSGQVNYGSSGGGISHARIESVQTVRMVSTPSYGSMGNTQIRHVGTGMGLQQRGFSGSQAQSIGAPGFVEGLLPVWGSGRNSLNEFQQGNYGWGMFYGALAVSDVFLVRSLATGIAKGAIKFGSHAWGVTSQWYKATRGISSEIPLHHWLLKRNMGIGRRVPNSIKNQPWNLKPIFPVGEYSAQVVHQAIHGKSNVLQLNIFNRINYGTPGWVFNFGTSYGGRLLGGLQPEEDY